MGGSPGPRWNVSEWAVAVTAWPVHLTEPSGQVASTRDCTGTGAPSPPRNASGACAPSAPFGQGTPKDVPVCAAGVPSSQRSSTSPGPVTGAAAAKSLFSARVLTAATDTPPRNSRLLRGSFEDTVTSRRSASTHSPDRARGSEKSRVDPVTGITLRSLNRFNNGKRLPGQEGVMDRSEEHTSELQS